jgi:hypothetical protein
MAWENIDIVLDAFETDKAASAMPPGTVNGASNIDFYTGTVRSLELLEAKRSMTQDPKAMQAFFDQSAAYVGLFGTLMQVWTPADTLVDIAPASGLTGAAYWDTTSFGKWCVVTNDTVGQVPHAISVDMAGTGGKLTPLAGWNSAWECTVIGTHRNVLWAADLIESGQAYPNRVRWSASSITDALPQTWIPAANNDAGQADLEIANSRIVDFAAVGDVMFMGGPGGLWAARWVGGAYVYNFSQINSTQGPRALRCMVSMGDAGAMLTPNDIIVFNETSQQSIAGGRILRLLEQFEEAQLMYAPTTRQLIVAYRLPGETGLRHSLIWNRENNTWGKRDYVETPLSCLGAIIVPVVQVATTWAASTYTWDQDARAWGKSYDQERLFAGANGTAIYAAKSGKYNWFLQRDNIPSPNGDDIRVRGLELDCEAPAGSQIRMRVGSSNFSGQAPTWGPIKTYTVGQDKLRHDDLQQGKYISYQLNGQGSIRITSLRIYYNVRGARP